MENEELDLTEQEAVRRAKLEKYVESKEGKILMKKVEGILSQKGFMDFFDYWRYASRLVYGWRIAYRQCKRCYRRT